jgi:RNA polymerase sigma-70 factor (ECF subfamily)
LLNPDFSGIQVDMENLMSKPDMQSLLDRIAAGRVDAYGEIVRAYQDQIRRIAAFAFHDRESAEDLVQQVFVNAYFKLEQFDRAKDFGPWLRTIARNQVREELRRRGRRTRHLEIYRDRLLARFEDGGKADHHEADLREALARCKESLAPKAADALEWRYMRSLGFDEIAARLGKTLAATRQMLSRIRLRLRECIKERMAEG